MGKAFLKRLAPALVFLLFAGALWLLHHQLRHYRYHEVVASVIALSAHQILAAVGLMITSYWILTGYDFLALHYIRRKLGYGKAAIASFTGYVLSYNIGMSVLGGTAVRFRLYSLWGLSAVEITKVVAFCGLTFWIGMFAIAGGVLTFGHLALPPSLGIHMSSLRPVGVVMMSIAALYLGLCATVRKTLTFRGWTFSLPSFRVAATQISLGCLDMLAASAVLFALLPNGETTYGAFLGVYLVAISAGLISHVPGGIGIFETVLLFGLHEDASSVGILGALLAYRAIYYLLPLIVALSILAAHELFHRKAAMKQVAAEVGRWVPQLAPRAFAFTTFLSGIILLLSGAIPSEHSRLAWLHHFLPLPVVEISHLLGSIIGVLLLFLARGLQRRINGAYHTTIALLAGGIVLSLLKGWDVTEAAVLLLMLLLMLPCRRFFYRKSSFLDQRFTPGWILAIILVLGATTWVGFFSFKHVNYSEDLWWRFSLRGDAPRFLRASLSAVVLAGGLGFAFLMRSPKTRPGIPDSEDLDQADNLSRKSRSTVAYLSLLGDKSILFSDSGQGFIMFSVQGKTWVAMGDPVGPPDERAELAWRFRELADREGGWAAFYQATRENLHIYLDCGLSLTKIGEEARVPLNGFSLEGSNRKGLRQTVRRVERDGCSFEIIPRNEVPLVLPELRRISDGWLAAKNTREKGFSLGFFSEDYIRRFPIGVARRDGRIVAFANCWLGGDKHELSVDLMRYSDEAPPSVMEYLFTQLMVWGAGEGYEQFSLGMAPFSGLENRNFAPVWNRVGAIIFRHGEHFYNFKGLRAYKEKFDPVWEPKYLATHGGIALPRIMTSIASLISGGLRGVITK